jgi:hypothetical protein
MTSDSESSYLAKTNGMKIEEIVQTLLPELQYVGKNLDAIYHDRWCVADLIVLRVNGQEGSGSEEIRTMY